MCAAQAALGDDIAFEMLVLRYQARVRRAVRALTGGDWSEAEDLTQETFIRAFRGIHRFRGESSFRTWLHRITLNVCWTHLARRHRGSCMVALEQDDEVRSSRASGGIAADDPEAELIARQAIERALSELSDEARLVVTLRDIQGLEYREIAALTGVPIGTVESRLFRARRHLRPALTLLCGPRLRRVVNSL